MVEFLKVQNSRVWRWSVTTAAKLTTGVLRALPPGALRSVGSAIEGQVNVVSQGAIQAGDRLQQKLVDLVFDCVTLSPLREAAVDIGFLGDGRGKGLQSQPELAYIETVNGTRPGGPMVVIPLVIHYTCLKRELDGISTIEGYLKKFELTSAQKAVYHGGIALLRSSRLKSLPPWKLPEQVTLLREILVDIKEAKRLTEDLPDYTTHHEKIFARWVSGILLAQLPWPAGDARIALEDLKWCERTIHSNADALENTCQFLNQIRYARAVLARNEGNEKEARKFLELSGYSEIAPDNLFIATVFATTPDGLRGGVRQVKESIPERVFTVSGVDLSDYNFFVTDDGTELVAVDSGSRPDRCEDAYRLFERRYMATNGKPVPKLTHCFMTHYHWDHTGGYEFFKTLNPEIVFYSRSNYVEERLRVLHQPPPWNWTLGQKFSCSSLAKYEPTHLIDQDMEMVIGGSKIRLILLPGGGGETPDGMLIYLYEHGVLYCGDFLVPWVGAPYVVEGSVDALLESMELVTQLKPQPKHLLTGHWAVTQFYSSVDVLARLKPRLQWLKEETLKYIFANKAREEIQQMNLTPPGLPESGEDDIHIPYIAMREVFIDRLYHQNVGYWGPQLQNVDNLSEREFGTVFRKYLGLSDIDMALAINTMVTAGDFELAGQVADWAITQYADSAAIKEARRLAFLQLKQKWQILNVFKFMMYSQHSDAPTAQPFEQFTD